MTMWIIFIILLTVMLTVDLGLNRKSHTISFREALTWSLVWIGLALAFNAGIWYTMGSEKALEFFTGYVIEKSLSVDNLFVFIMIFTYFGIAPHFQSRILKWGILGALVLRGIFIFAGIELLERFTWLLPLFGVLLLVTAWKMMTGGENSIDPGSNPMVRIFSRLLPVTRQIRGDWFIKKKRGILVASPLFLALVMVESSDVVFAIDSIPAIFAITLDPFIVFTSNIFAIMGLRALYFLLANLLGMFAYLKYGISVILAFVGCKMIAATAGMHVPIQISLLVIFSCLVLAIVASLKFGEKQTETANPAESA